MSKYQVIVKRPVVVEDWAVTADSEEEAIAAVMDRKNGARLLVSDASPPEVTVVRLERHRVWREGDNGS